MSPPKPPAMGKRNSRAAARRVALQKLYGPSCCGPVVQLADSLPNRLRGVSDGVEASFLRELHARDFTGARLHDGLYRSYYDSIIEQAELGWGRKFHTPTNESELRAFERMRKSASRFAAAKHHTLAAELRRLRSLPLQDFLRESAAYASLQNQAWLRTEARSAMVAAQSAENWETFQRRAYLYPNLRYDAVLDDRTRPQHAAWDGAVYPIEDPIWDERMPPNGWNCRCKVIQTDAAVNRRAPGFEPAAGFRHNPGKSGTLFSDDHPYYNLGEQRAADLTRSGELSRYRAVRLANVRMATERYGRRSFDLPDTPSPARIAPRQLRELVEALPRTSPAEPAVASDLLPALNVVAPHLVPLGAGVYRFELLGTTYLLEFVDSVLTSISTQ